MGQGYPSFRRALVDGLAAQQPFLALTDADRTLEVLLDQDPGFACHSLMGVPWDEAALQATTADQVAPVLLSALANGQAHPAARAHIRARLAQARAEMGLPAPQTAAAWAVASGLPAAVPASAWQVWWASLGPAPLPRDLAQVDPAAPGQWEDLARQAHAWWAARNSTQARAQAARFVPPARPAAAAPRP